LIKGPSKGFVCSAILEGPGLFNLGRGLFYIGFMFFKKSMKRIKTICHNRMLLIKSKKLVSAIPARLNCGT
jgi:hypothetical protein